MAKTRDDLDAVIAGLPAQIEAAVDAALSPVIADIIAKNKANASLVDFQPEVDRLTMIGSSVADAVAKDIAGPVTTTEPTVVQGG